MSRAGSPLVPRPNERFDARLSPLFVQRPFNRLGVEFDYPTAGPATAWNRSSGLMTDADMNFSRYLLPMTALAMMTGYAAAQTPAPSTPAAKPAVTAPAPAASGQKVTTSSGERTAKSKACSDQADQKGLHGKARKKFRDACKKA